ncbi:MAG TPA: ABC transporter permease [Firmicutes bacterium]|nr:ABC transporter permease [Bacillota bacterium]HHT41824.1 ABC transporter permease [Bacillota bacterium]
MRTKIKALPWQELLLPLAAVVLALLIGSVFILYVGENPLTAYGILFKESLGSVRNIATTLQRATPLMFTGMAVAFAFRAGLFNIGAEGQLYIGAFAAAWVGFTFANLPRIIHLPLAIVAGMAGGALWASIAGVLKAKLGVHEVINTIMLNFIALFLTDWLVTGPFHGGSWVPETARISASAALSRIYPPTRLTTAVYLAVVAAAAVYLILWKTKRGYELRAVGLNPSAAEYGGINVARNTIIAMAISGALAGLAGTEQILGLHNRFILRFSSDLGFMGVAVALLGKNHPVGVILAAILFGALQAGSAAMDRLTAVPRELITIIQALIIFFVAAEYLIRRMLRLKEDA